MVLVFINTANKIAGNTRINSRIQLIGQNVYIIFHSFQPFF